MGSTKSEARSQLYVDLSLTQVNCFFSQCHGNICSNGNDLISLEKTVDADLLRDSASQQRKQIDINRKIYY